jgi:hypothetical protein
MTVIRVNGVDIETMRCQKLSDCKAIDAIQDAIGTYRSGLNTDYEVLMRIAGILAKFQIIDAEDEE